MHQKSRTTIDSIFVIEQVFADLKAGWERDMLRRALAAYHRQGGLEFPDPECSHIAKHEGDYYAYVANRTGALAVYGIRGARSFSLRLKSWPKAIEQSHSKSSPTDLRRDHIVLEPTSAAMH